jgi:hypothetical protein
MSLDVYLKMKTTPRVGHRIFICEDGRIKEISRERWDELHPGIEPVSVDSQDDCVYSGNITHNLGKMAKDAGIYQALWRPEEIHITKAKQLIGPLEDGLSLLLSDPERFKQFNPENGWGSYDILVEFVHEYLDACKRYPDAEVKAWR